MPTKKSDIYSYAIVLVEIFTREDPYHELRGHMEPTEIIKQVQTSHLRPEVTKLQPVSVREVCLFVWLHLMMWSKQKCENNDQQVHRVHQT